MSRRRASAASLLTLFAALVAAPLAADPTPFAGRALRTVSGAKLALGDSLAKGPVLLDFWATWCRPCEHSLPAVQRLHERVGARGVSVVGVSIDGPRNWARVRPFAARLGLTFPIVIDEDGALARRFRVQAVPTSVLLAADGRVIRTHSGFHPAEEESLQAAIDVLLADVQPESR